MVQFVGDQLTEAFVLFRDEMLWVEVVNVEALSLACPWMTKLHGFWFSVSSQVN